jgi:hypothetical protein
MLSLTIKDIRDGLTDALFEHYSLADFAVRGTTVKDKEKEFRIEFRIYDSEFWMDIDPSIDSIHIGTRSFGGPDRLDTIQIWLSKPFEYDASKFEFGWREDLKVFFDSFHKALMEKVEKAQKTTAGSVYGSSAKPVETETGEGKAGAAVIAAILDGLDTNKSATKDNKPSIFNSLKEDDKEEEDEYI